MDDFESDFDELDKLIAEEVTKGPHCDYDESCIYDGESVLEGAYSKIAFYSETTWWDKDEVDEYRVNNLGLWSAVMGCNQCKWNQSIPVNDKLIEIDDETSESNRRRESRRDFEDEDNTAEWLKTTPWPASLLKLYPQIPDAVASKNLSIFSHFHSTFAGDLLYSKIGSVKELIQYNRLKQDCVKNLWNQAQPFHDLLNVSSELPAELKVKSKEDVICKKNKNIDDRLNTINEICDSFNAIISLKNGPIIKGEIDNEKLEVKIKLLERRKTLYDFQKEFENAFESLPPALTASKGDNQNQGNQCKKMKSEKTENSYARKSFNNKNKNNQTEVSKKNYKFSEKSSNLIKENFGSFPINQGEIIETLEEVCQWLHNVYPHKPRDNNLPKVPDQSNPWTEKLTKETAQPSTELIPVRKKNGANNQVTKILPRPNNVSDFSCQMLSQIPSRRLYRDVLTNAEVQSGLEPDPVNKFAELEREAIEQYSGCSISSETSIALLHIDEDSKFKDLEREAIEQYQPEEDSIITSGELFTSSELMKQSPVATPHKVHSSTQVNIFEAECKKEKSCLSCQALRKSSSEYLLCLDTWPEGAENTIQFENIKTQTDQPLKMKNETELKHERDLSVLKSLRGRESMPVTDIFKGGGPSAFKNLTYTSPYDSPSEDLQPEECCSKMVKLILNKNQTEQVQLDDFEKFSEKQVECKETKVEDQKIIESCSKIKESDEERSGLDDAKKKRKKKKRSRKKKGCKKDGGGGGGGGNGRGGGGRCDARTPIHCPVPLSSKTSESKIKKKDDSCKKDKKGETTSNSLPCKWQRLNSVIATIVRMDNGHPMKISIEDFLYDERCLERLALDETANISLPHNLIMSIPSYLFLSKNENQVSVLTDLMYYRLKKWGWCYLSYKELFAKCLNCCCFNQSELFPSWLKWCKCFRLRVGQCHLICPGSILAPDIWRIPKQDVFNPKYWELSGGGILQGIIIDLDKSIHVLSLIDSLINTSYYTLFKYQDESLRNFSINQYKYLYEMCSQKVYHVCNNSWSSNIEALNLQKKTNTRKFHRGKNNKIKGKTFCYYCSGNSFKNYTLHTFFCEVDAQNKGVSVDREKGTNFPIKKAWATAGTSSKYQQTEKDLSIGQEELPDDSVIGSATEDSTRCLNSSCYKCQKTFVEDKIFNSQYRTNNICPQTPVVSSKDLKNNSNYNFGNEKSLVSSQTVQNLNYQEDSGEESDSFKRPIMVSSGNSQYLSSYDLPKSDGENSKPLIDYLYDQNEYISVSFEGFSYSKFKEMTKIDQPWIQNGSNRNSQTPDRNLSNPSDNVTNGLNQFQNASDQISDKVHQEK